MKKRALSMMLAASMTAAMIGGFGFRELYLSVCAA